MAFVKAKIFVDISGTLEFEKQFDVLFNPSDYSIASSNSYNWAKVKGLSLPIAQFDSGESDTLTMELFFDTYEAKSDVRFHTSKISGLLDIIPDLHAPPVVRFVWGNLNFTGVVTNVSQKFTMFSGEGVPVRATLNVTFKAWMSKSEQLKKLPRNSADRTKQKTINQGDQLWMIAAKEYVNPALWRDIANANGIDNPRLLQSGKKIVVPRLE
ncbi:LysM peptidoglycan-binding domain-containing protein [Paenibacillus psychroresistens]|uniref:LysM peptidoglycan-binding domain-containing protein n=1 Tax=Paenibacillus psychroresistens TaxID=1778678 RepID=A0A6B8RLK7_9BACL|nr:LysM peptidoglycan-binding domain-containing protein [Paenibacillus psychroresistens]QGQ96644.1 LysM peptidoglycan-binding domain-containing protein [Paenibacillus psychroresistens]